MSREMKNKIKEFVYNNYWFFLSIAIFVSFFVDEKIEFLGALFGLIYFIHTQKLNETIFFLENFKKFNQRYDRLNETLTHAIHDKKVLEQRDAFVDYFNLCSEEYMLYQKGYIPNQVWSSWVKGMSFYWEDEAVRQLWNKECNDSFYGFNFNIIFFNKLDNH